MSLGEIVKTALIDTALGMGTVFFILIIISVVIWLLGKTAGATGKKKAETAPVPAVNEDGLTPELVAAIAAVAINQHLREHQEASQADEYIVRNIRRATWKRT